MTRYRSLLRYLRQHCWVTISWWFNEWNQYIIIKKIFSQSTDWL